MEYKSGVLGVIVIALALTGALFGSYLAGIEPIENEVIKYDYLADVSGLFEYDQSPQYIDYDPSSNYVGYYSTDSYDTVTKKYYFAEDEVGYKLSTRVNNYAIKQMPVIGPETTVDISSLSDLDAMSGRWHLRYCYTEEGERNIGWENDIYTLKEIISKMTIPSTVTSLRISLGDVDWDKVPSGSQNKIELDTIIIIPTAQFKTIGTQYWGYIANPNLDLASIQENYDTVTIYEPYQSFEVNLSTGDVTAYFDSDYQNRDPKTYKWDSLAVCSGNNNSQLSQFLNLSTDMTYQTSSLPSAKYLDPNDGVYLKDGE